MSVAFFFVFFSFFPAASAPPPPPPALVCCRFHCFGADGASLFCLNFTTPFLFPEPHTVWHPPTCSISSPRSSSFSLSGAVREPLLPFPFVSSPRPFYRGCFYPPGFFFFFCSNFWPFRPGILSSLLSTAWFHLEWFTFLASQNVLVSFKVFSLQTRTDSPLFEDLVLLQSKSLWEVYSEEAAPNQPGTQLAWTPGLRDPQLALFLPISYYRCYCYCEVFQQLSAAAFTVAIKWISPRQLCTRSESNEFFTLWDKTKALLLENWVEIIS